MSRTRTRENHRESKLERREVHRVHVCAHGIPRLVCDACEATERWRGVRFQTTMECLEVEAAVTSVY